MKKKKSTNNKKLSQLFSHKPQIERNKSIFQQKKQNKKEQNLNFQTNTTKKQRTKKQFVEKILNGTYLRVIITL